MLSSTPAEIRTWYLKNHKLLRTSLLSKPFGLQKQKHDVAFYREIYVINDANPAGSDVVRVV